MLARMMTTCVAGAALVVGGALIPASVSAHGGGHGGGGHGGGGFHGGGAHFGGHGGGFAHGWGYGRGIYPWGYGFAPWPRPYDYDFEPSCSYVHVKYYRNKQAHWHWVLLCE